jgi:hypothetical protein
MLYAMPRTAAKKGRTPSRRSKDKSSVILRLRVNGPGIRKGRIPVPELIRICQEAQNAVNRQAEALQGRNTVHPGPIPGVIRRECTLELVDVGSGSATLDFDLQRAQLPLDLDAAILASEAVAVVGRAIRNFSNRDSSRTFAKHLSNGVPPGVLNSLYNLAGVTESNKISSVEWITPKRGHEKRVAAEINKDVRARIASQLSRPRHAEFIIDGVLDEADFGPHNRKCRVDPALGSPVSCTFDPTLDNIIYTLLRKPVRIMGAGILPPYSDRPDEVKIGTITELPSLELGKAMFGANLSIEELAASQDIKPLRSGSVLATAVPEEEDIDEVLREIYSSRK